MIGSNCSVAAAAFLIGMVLVACSNAMSVC
jgi:hypothetical protein